jgi:hypothetical protein
VLEVRELNWEPQEVLVPAIRDEQSEEGPGIDGVVTTQRLMSRRKTL